MNTAANAYEALKNKIAELNEQGKEDESKAYHEKFMQEINDDMNIPRALAVLNGVINDSKLSKKAKLGLIADFDEILGLDLLKEEKIEIPKEVMELADKREKARKENNYELADKLRGEIKAKGFIVEDTKKGPVLKKA